MRTFYDPSGRRWQAALLEASYGHILLVFNSYDGNEVMQVQMDADTMAEASQMLQIFDQAELQVLLDQARSWDETLGIFTLKSQRSVP